MTNNSPYFYYLCSGRSFHAANPGRKISEVVKIWRQLGFDVEHICGGDVTAGKENFSEPLGANKSCEVIQKRPSKSKLKSFLSPLVHSLSEKRDIVHDKMVLQNIRLKSQVRKPKLVWERSSRLHESGLVHARELKVPYVLEWKDHLVDYSYSWYRNKALQTEARKNREADWIVVESEVLKRQLAMKKDVSTDKILVAHNAVDSEAFLPNSQKGEEWRRGNGFEGDCILVGYLGSFSFYHDSKRLVLAANEIKKRGLSGDYQFVMIGDGKELNETIQLAKSLGLSSPYFRFLPRVGLKEVPEILSGLDIAVLPGSTDIICPIKIQEYMASETATIAPDFDCNKEVITDGVDGVLFKPNCESSLAESIVFLGADEGIRNRIARVGRKKMVTSFSWRETWGKVLEGIINGCRC